MNNFSCEEVMIKISETFHQEVCWHSVTWGAEIMMQQSCLFKWFPASGASSRARPTSLINCWWQWLMVMWMINESFSADLETRKIVINSINQHLQKLPFAPLLVNIFRSVAPDHIIHILHFITAASHEGYTPGCKLNQGLLMLPSRGQFSMRR